MELAPIIVFAYNRPDHLHQTLDSLSKNDLAKDSILYIYCDGPKENSNNEQLQKIADTRGVAHNVTEFKEIHVLEAPQNKGLGSSIIDGVTAVVNQYGRAIIFEDDVISTRGCLTYLNDALELYQNDEQVMHVSAWMYPNKKHFPETFFYDSPYPAGGWATWQRAWAYFDNDTKGHISYWEDHWNDFEIMGGDVLRRQLYANLKGKINTWYIKWYSSMHKIGGLCLYPHKALTNNIGWDNSGETSNNTNRYEVVNPVEYVKVERIPIVRNKSAFKYIRKWYSGHWYSKRYRKQLLEKLKQLLHVS